MARKKIPIGVDLKGNIRYRHSKNNPILLTSQGIATVNETGKQIPICITLKDILKGDLVRLKIG